MRSFSRTSLAAMAVLAGSVALGGCATKGYVNEQIATVNQRIDGLDGRLRTVEGTSGQALAAAQAAAGQAQQNGQRIDQLQGRVDGLDQQVQQMRARPRRPRG
jgi:murein lipoprotein